MTSTSDLPPATEWPKPESHISPVDQIDGPATAAAEQDAAAAFTPIDQTELQSTADAAAHLTADESAGSDNPDAPTTSPVEPDMTVEHPTLAALTEAVSTLRAALRASEAAQEHQRALVDKLHDERQALREAEQRRFRDPVVRELIQLSDTCLRNSRQWKTRAGIDPDTAAQVSAVLLDAAADVGLVLERQGVESFAPLIDDKFDRAIAKAMGSRETTDSSMDGRVAEIQKPGYRVGDRIIRFSEVFVWKVQIPKDPNSTPNG